MQNFRTEETIKKDPWLFKHEDIRGGGTVSIANLGAATEVPAGTPVGKDPSTGLYHVIKAAKLYENEANTETDYKVLKGHTFEVDDFITGPNDGKAYAITAIDTSNAAYDVITVGTTLGVAYTEGQALYEADAEDATGGASSLNHTPIGYVGTGFDIVAGDNHSTQIVVRGTLQEDLLDIPVPAVVKTATPLVLFQ